MDLEIYKEEDDEEDANRDPDDDEDYLDDGDAEAGLYMQTLSEQNFDLQLLPKDNEAIMDDIDEDNSHNNKEQSFDNINMVH